MTTTLVLPKWYDLHVHMRQGDLLAPLIEQHLGMACVGVVAMPNTTPPIERIFDDEPGQGWSIQSYRTLFMEAGGSAFKTAIFPLYLSPETTPAMIERGAREGLLRACKYYPPHATTNSDDSADLSYFMKNGVLAAMQDHGVILCVHGEQHGLSGEAYYGRSSNAETSFYHVAAPALVRHCPNLKIICEHISSKTGIDFVRHAGKNVAATVTPQHLLYTVGNLLQGLKYHLYCAPIVKFEEDLDAIRKAVTDKGNTSFFAGTDSAPHTTKITPCCGAAGCFTGGVAPQLYAEAFEKAGADLASAAGALTFKNFLCLNGPAFYGLDVPAETFTLAKTPQEVTLVTTPAGPLTPLPIGMQPLSVAKTALAWSISV